jgi:hypothetical protein
VKKRYGISNPIWLIVIILVLAAIACGSSGGEDKISDTSEESAQVEKQAETESSANEEANDSSEEFVDDQTEEDEPASSSAGDVESSDQESAEMEPKSDEVMQADFEDIQAMQVTMAAENLDTGEIMEASYSFVQPDRFLANLVGLETLVIGDTSYTRISQGEWAEQALLPAGITQNAVEEMTTGFLGQAAIYELLDDPGESGLSQSGEETVNGVDTLVYTYDGGISSPLAGIIHGEVKVWLGKDDGLLYRQEVVNSTDSGLGPRSKSIIEFFYGDAVAIEDPE